MKKSKFCMVSLLAVLTLCGCNNGTTSSSVATSSASSEEASSEVASSSEAPVSSSVEAIEDFNLPSEDSVYASVYGDYEKLIADAAAISDDSERYAAYAKAEAYLLDTQSFLPCTTSGGKYALSHVAYRSCPTVEWGFDSDRLKSAVVATSFIDKEDREALKEAWTEAQKKGNENPDAYDAKAVLKDLGYSFTDTYTTTFDSLPETLDIQATSRQADTEVIVQGVDALMEYSTTNTLRYALADSMTVSDDGLKYTFHIRDGVNWYKADKSVYGAVTADDFVAGFQHMLDAQGGLESLVSGVVKGVSKYLDGKISADDFEEEVGVYSDTKGNLVIELEKETPYFPTMLTYNIFTPLNRTFFTSKGGAFGIKEYADAQQAEGFDYAISGEPDSILYNGAFICTKMTKENEMIWEATPDYYDAAHRNVQKLDYIYNDGSDIASYYADVVAGTYAGISLSSTTLELAKKDGNFDQYAYITSTGSTTYFAGNNLHREAYDCYKYPTYLPSAKTDLAKKMTQKAMLNKNFRKAMNYAFNKTAYNAVSAGADLANASLRNMYTSPDFCNTTKSTTYAGKTFDAYTTYGDMVQAYFNEYNSDGVQLQDGVNGWYNPELAKSYLETALTELNMDVTKDNPIEIDIINYSASSTMEEQAQVYKKSIEEALGGLVKVNVLDTPYLAVYYYCGYYAAYGSQANYDVFFGSGWGPDFGDPITYLDTFLSQGDGYMSKVCGLY